MTRRNVAVVAALLAIVALAWAAAQHLAAPRQAPSVGYTLLDGRVEQLQDLRGKVVLVSFWATTCGPCVREMPKLVETQRSFGARGFETLAVAMQYDPPARVVQFAQSRQLPFGVAIDNRGEIARAFGHVRATPTHVLIDRRGEIVARHVGMTDFEALHRRLEALLTDS